MFFGKPLYWRDTQRPVKFFIFDGSIVVALMICLMHLRLWTFILVVIFAFVLLYFSRKGISSGSIFRFLKAGLAGKVRPARQRHLMRPPVSYSFETREMVQAEKDFQAARTKSVADALRKKKASGK